MPSIFDYDEIHEGFAREGFIVPDAPSGYSMVATVPGGMSGFWQVMRSGFSPDDTTGWKVHITIAVEDLPRAWKLVSEYLVEEGVAAFKVAAPDTARGFSNPEGLQSGKMITIYDSVDGPDLRRIMENVERILREHGIRPGPAVKNERAVPGSDYLSYRNDYDQNGRYISNAALEASDIPSEMRYNVSGRQDPYRDFAIDSARAGHSPAVERPAPSSGWERHHSARMGGDVARLDVTDRFPNIEAVHRWVSSKEVEAKAVSKGDRLYIYSRLGDQRTQGAIDSGLDIAARGRGGAPTPAVQSLDEMLAAKSAAGQIDRVPTNKGYAIVFRGDTAGLERELTARGVQVERLDPSAGFGDGLRVRTASVADVNNMIDGANTPSVNRPNPTPAPRRNTGAVLADIGGKAVGGAGIGLGAVGLARRAGDELHESNIAEVRQDIATAVAGDAAAVALDAGGMTAEYAASRGAARVAETAAANGASRAATAATAAQAARFGRIATGAGVLGGLAVGVSSYAEAKYADALEEQAVNTDDRTERASLAEEAAAADGRSRWGLWAGLGAVAGAAFIITAPVSVPVLIGVGIGSAAVGIGGAMAGDYLAREHERETGDRLREIEERRSGERVADTGQSAQPQQKVAAAREPSRDPDEIRIAAAQYNGPRGQISHNTDIDGSLGRPNISDARFASSNTHVMV